MNYIEYIQNGTNLSDGKSTGWMINFGRYPTANTKIEIKFKHQNSATDGFSFFGCHKYDRTNNYFRLFTYQNNTYTLDSPGDGQSRLSVPVTFNQEVTLQATPAPNLSLTNLNTQQTSTETNGTTPDYKYPMALWYGFDGDSGEVVEGTQVYYIKIWENNVLVMDLWPAVDNGVVGLYDKIGGQMYTNTGSDKVFTAGPVLSSIVATPSKTNLANAGETINIAVVCENAWTVTGNTWLTLSAASGTGNTTITATAPDYSTGTTARTDALTFTDTVTGDEFEITIKQKKYSAGQPVYLGGFEITELYLGGNQINEAYLGDALVYSSGPFVGLKAIPSSISFNGSTLQKTVKVKSSEAWTMNLPSWITASTTTGNAGETVVTLTATSQQENTSATISLTSENYSASITCQFWVIQFGGYVELVQGVNVELPLNLYNAYSTNNYLRFEMNFDIISGYILGRDYGGLWFSLEKSGSTNYWNIGSSTGLLAANSNTNGYTRTYVMTLNNNVASDNLGNSRNFSGTLPNANLILSASQGAGLGTSNFYEMKVYDSQTNLLYDFVGAFDGTDPCIFDKVGGGSYFKSGNGTISYHTLS